MKTYLIIRCKPSNLILPFNPSLYTSKLRPPRPIRAQIIAHHPLQTVSDSQTTALMPKPPSKPISLDGSTLEGGGQLVRVAFSLSAITGVPVHVYNIRANRAPRGSGRGSLDIGGKGARGSRGGSRGRQGQGQGTVSRKVEGGAKESHLAAMLWLAGRCDAYLEGADLGSREITFIPRAGTGRTNESKGGGLVDATGDTIRLERPGSVCLILQCILPYLLFAPSRSVPTTKSGTHTEGDQPFLTDHTNTLGTPSADASPSTTTCTTVTLHGGTNVDKAMSVDYVQHVFLPMLSRLIGPTLPDITLETVRRGWAGSASQVGEIKVTVRAHMDAGGGFKIGSIKAVERGNIERIGVVIVADGEEVRGEVLSGLRSEIATVLGGSIPVHVLAEEDSGDIRRLYVLLVAYTSGGHRLGRDFLGSGRRPKNAAEQRKIVEECVKSVVRGLNGEVKRGGCVDEFMADQLVLFQSLTKGEGMVDGGDWMEKGNGRGVEVEVGDEGGSLHARTVRWVCEKMLRRVGGVEFAKGGYCRGAGWNWGGDGSGVVPQADEE